MPRAKTIGYICTIDGEPAGFDGKDYLYYSASRHPATVFPDRKAAESVIRLAKRQSDHGDRDTRYGIRRLVAAD